MTLILSFKKWKDCKNQRRWRTPEEQDLLNQLNKAHMIPQKLNQAQVIHEFIPSPLHIYYNYYLSNFMELLTVRIK